MIKVFIGGVNKNEYIKLRTLQITNVLTRQIDTCSFQIVSHTGHTYKPAIGDEVIIYDDDDKIFGGNIIGMEEIYEAAGYLIFQIDCVDYTNLMDKGLVVEVYQDKTVNDIIEEIRDDYMPAGFTLTNVNCDKVVNYIAFNYEQPSKCLQILADLFNYDWYVDYDKDIHFFAKESNDSPFDLTDLNGNYLLNTLRLRRDNSQLKNSVIIRGGEYLGDSYTEYQLGDATKTDFKLAYKYSGLTVTVNAVPQDVGVDFLDDPTLHDCLYNFQEKIVKFRNDNKPGNGVSVNISGLPYVPVIVKVTDNNSIATFGEKEFVIVDKTIKSNQAAKDRAEAELEVYKTTISEGSFRTHKKGLRSGQTINIQSILRNINETYLINKVVMTMRNSEKSMFYDITLVTSKTFGMIEFLQRLMMDEKTKIEINKDEVVDKIITKEDTFPTFTEQVPVYSKTIPPWYCS